jgi:hypothetical protein
VVQNIIKSYKVRLSEITEMIDGLNDDRLVLQSKSYPPATICHPLWTLGHLCISAQGIGEEMSMDHWLDDSWIGLYGQHSNPTNSIYNYHRKVELIHTLHDCEKKIEARLLSMTRDELDGPMPDVRYHDIFPTLGHAICGILI